MSANPNLKFNVLNDTGTQIFNINQTTGINSTLTSFYSDTTLSTNSSSASFVLLGGLSIDNTSNSFSYTEGGSVTIAGGIAIGNDSYIGGTIYTSRISSGSINTPGLTVGTIYVTTITGGNIQVSDNTSIGNNLSVDGLVQLNNTTVSTNNSTASTVLKGGLSISSSNASSYTEGGSLTIEGGASISQDAYIGGTIYTTRISSESMATPGITAGTLYVNSITGGSIQVSGDVTIGGSLTVLGATTILNITTANQVETNVTSTNIFLIGNLIAGDTSHTLGNIYLTNGNVGIGTVTPITTLDVFGTANFTTSVTTGALFSTNLTTTNIVGTNITVGSVNATGVQNLLNTTTIPSTTVFYSLTSGALNISGDIVVSGTELYFTTEGVNPPTLNGRSLGSKIILYPETDVTKGDYSIGIESNYTWFQVPSLNNGYKFYQGTTTSLIISSAGNIGIGNTSPNQYLEISSVPYLSNQDGGIRISTRDYTGLNDSSYRYFDIRLQSDVSSNFRSSFIGTLSGGVPTEYEYMSLSQDGYLNIESLSKFNNITSCSNSSTGSVVLQGGLSIDCPTNAIDVLNGGALTIAGGAAIAGDLIVGGSITYSNAEASSSTFSYLTLTATDWSIDVANGALVVFGGISVQTTTNAFSATEGNGLTVAGGAGIGADLYVGEVGYIPTVISTDNTTTNIVITNASTGTHVGTTISTANVYSSLSTITNLVSTNISSTNYIGTTISTANTYHTLGTITNLSSTNISSGTFVGTTISTANFFGALGTITNLVTTNMSTSTLIGTNINTTNITGSSFVGTTLSTSNIYSTLGTINNLVGVNLSSSNLISTFATIPNSILSNITSTSIIISGGGLLATFNSNTLGNIFTTGGNVGINTTSPDASLDINTSNTFGQIYVSNNLQNRKIVLWNGENNDHQFFGFGVNSNIFRYQINNVADNHVFYAGTNPTVSNELFRISGMGNISVSNTANLPTISSGNILSTNITTTNLNVTNIFSSNNTLTNLLATNNTLTNLNLTSQTVTNILATNITTISLNITGITAGFGWFTNSLTVSNLLANNFTVSSIFSTTITLGTLLITTGITTPNILTTNLTSTNELITNSTITSARITNQISTNISSSTINATDLTAGNINFTGALYQNGSLYISSQWTTFGTNLAYTTGNVGINTTSPTYLLDINGDARIRNTSFSTNSTTGALVMDGGISITGTNASSITMGGGLTIDGGGSISQDLYIGGNIYIKGIDNTLLTGTQTIGSYSGTGTYQVNVTLERTMANTSYKIVGSLKTTSDNTNVYTVSFINTTTTGFTANIYRIDALGSGWTDTNLTLSYIIYP